jgi:hypothetical protein
MTMLLTMGTMAAAVTWLLARARLEAQQLKCFRVTRQQSRRRIIYEEQVNER